MLFRGRTVLAAAVLAACAVGVAAFVMNGAPDDRTVPAFAPAAPVSAPRAAERPGLAEGALGERTLGKLSEVYKLLEERYLGEIDPGALEEGALEGMIRALGDPYSEYLNAEEMESFTDHIHSSFTGIGAEVALQDGLVVIVSPIRNSPAERAGLRAGDQILAVNGESLQGLALSEAVEKIRGPKGTQAKLTIRRQGSQQVMDIIVVRDDISLETVESAMLEDGIGLISISQFAVQTGDRFLEELAALEAQGMKGLIIDLRNNPGGVVQAVQAIAEALVPEGGTIMHLEYRDGRREKTVSASGGKPYPIVALINEGSASASEILAAAIRESAGGRLVGQRTYGKGLVQSTIRLSDGSGVKLTIAKWLTPRGETIHESGIAPDVHVPRPKLFDAVSIPKDRVWMFDMTGDEVKNIQLILEGLGYPPGRNDGYFSRETAAAVEAFQREHGLPVTGRVDEATAMKLEEMVIRRYLDRGSDVQLKEAVNQIQKMLADKAGK